MTEFRERAKAELTSWFGEQLDIATVDAMKEFYDMKLLDRLAQPTRYEARRRRVEALARYKELCVQLATARLSEYSAISEYLGKKVTAFMELYKFTQEELDGSST